MKRLNRDTLFNPNELSQNLAQRSVRGGMNTMGSLLKLEIKVRANGSLESASHRISFLARLLEKYSICNLLCDSKPSTIAAAIKPITLKPELND